MYGKLLDRNRKLVEVHRDPDEGRYLTVTAHVPGDVLTPIAEPKARRSYSWGRKPVASGSPVPAPRGDSSRLPSHAVRAGVLVALDAQDLAVTEGIGSPRADGGAVVRVPVGAAKFLVAAVVPSVAGA